MNNAERPTDLATIDFTKYDLTSVRDDVASVVNVPTALMQSVKWTGGISLAIGVVTWFVFSNRMPTALAILVVLGAVILSFFSAVIIGGSLVAKDRLDTVAQATDRVVSAMGEMHVDVVKLKDGATTTTVRQLSTGLLQHAVLPVVFGLADGMAGAGGGGIVNKMMSLASSRSTKLVEKSVIAAVQLLPDREIGSLVDTMTESVADTSEIIAGVNDEYQKVGERIESVVSGVSKATLGSGLTVAAAALIPLIVWLAAAWVAS